MQLHGRITVKELFETGFITRRSHTVCNRAGLLSLGDIAKYYRRNKNFLSLQNCGKTVNNELVKLCYDFKRNGAPEEEAAAITATFENNSEAQANEESSSEQTNAKTKEAGTWELAEMRYQELKTNLSRRARNRLLAFCNGTTLNGFLEMLGKRNSPKLKQVLSPDLTSGAELCSFIAKVNEILPASSEQM